MRNKYTNLGWLVTLIIALVPVVIWLSVQPTQWDTAQKVAENLGRLCGLAGLSLMAWNVILSARLKIFGRLFMGLDNMYRAHHLIGSTAFMLLLIHPSLLTLRYVLGSLISAYEFLKPSFESPYRFLGEFALASMVVLMWISLYMNVRHERFILTQRLLGVVLFIGALHAIFVGGSDINSLLPLQIYILGLVFAAGLVYVYRSLFHGSFHKFLDYDVQNIQYRGDIIELYLQPVNTRLSYQPGQFAFIKFQTHGLLGQSHPFSISSDPKSEQLRFSIKQLGDYTEALSDIKIGSEIKIDGPYGSFSNQVITSSRQIWIAGGIGITPFLAMAQTLPAEQKVDLYYSIKTPNEAVYAQELQKVAANNFRLFIINTDKDGFLTADTIMQTSRDLQNAEYFICGPIAMMNSLRSQLRAKGIRNKNIHTEEFALA